MKQRKSFTVVKAQAKSINPTVPPKMKQGEYTSEAEMQEENERNVGRTIICNYVPVHARDIAVSDGATHV